MKVTIIVKEDHIDLLHKASIGEIEIFSDEFKVDWALYSNYVAGYVTVQIDYDLYVKLQDTSNIK